MSASQTILGIPPSKSNSYRIAGNRLIKTEAVRAYERSFALQCRKYAGMNIDQPFSFSISVFYPNMRSDLDGCFKIVLDCLQQIKAISNDNLCMAIEATKHIDKENPRIVFSITAL